jgi:hypothetical protein
MEKTMKKVDVVAMVLLTVGGLNWGLVGLANFDLVAAIFGQMSVVSRLVYVVVGLSAAYEIFGWKAIQKRWATVSA